MYILENRTYMTCSASGIKSFVYCITLNKKTINGVRYDSDYRKWYANNNFLIVLKFWAEEVYKVH